MPPLPSRRCTACTHPFAGSAERCPHCGLPGLFPNVYAAEQPSEAHALKARYDAAVTEAAARNADAAVRAFEAAVQESRAVIARDVHEVTRLASSDREVYATYYGLVDAEVRIPEGSGWHVLRSAADEALFGGYKDRIRFAALTLDGRGLSNYGGCSMVLRTDMIAHRASVFEENSVLWMMRRGIRYRELDFLPAGYRATWQGRHQLAVAKLAGRIDENADPGAFPGLLLVNGRTREEDDCVEVHVYGALTVRTMERVTLTLPRRRRRQVLAKAAVDQLQKFGVEVEVG